MKESLARKIHSVFSKDPLSSQQGWDWSEVSEALALDTVFKGQAENAVIKINNTR